MKHVELTLILVKCWLKIPHFGLKNQTKSFLYEESTFLTIYLCKIITRTFGIDIHKTFPHHHHRHRDLEI